MTKYALAFGKTIYVKRMANLYMTKEVDAESGATVLEFEVLFEGVPVMLSLVHPERVHPGTAEAVELWTAEVWNALCVEFDREIEAYVTRLLTQAAELGQNELTIIASEPVEAE